MLVFLYALYNYSEGIRAQVTSRGGWGSSSIVGPHEADSAELAVLGLKHQ